MKPTGSYLFCSIAFKSNGRPARVKTKLNPATLVKKDKKAIRNRHNQGQQSVERKQRNPPESANLSAKSANLSAKSAKSVLKIC